MKHKLDFAYFTILPNNIVEVTVDNGITLSLENVETCHEFVKTHVNEEFSLLINLIHDFSFSYEAKLSVASHENLKAIAFVTYNKKGQSEIEDLLRLRKIDNLNAKIYSGLELGWQEARKWLEQEMESSKVS